MSVLGLDISTTYIGVVLLDDSWKASDVTIPKQAILLMQHIDFKKCKTIWEKADKVKQWFEDNKSDLAGVKSIWIEDPAKKFTMGQSSASTIVTLARFNGLVSYIARNALNIDPDYIAPGAARKACGLKMQQKKRRGLTHKEQTFNAIMASDLAHVSWPKKMRSVNIVDWAYDIIDAFVVAKAGLTINSLTE